MSNSSAFTHEATWTEMMEIPGTSSDVSACDTVGKTVSPESLTQSETPETNVSHCGDFSETSLSLTLKRESSESISLDSSNHENTETVFPVSLVTLRAEKPVAASLHETATPAASLMITPVTPGTLNSMTSVTPQTPGSSEPPSKRRRVELSLAGKVRLIKCHEAQPNITYTELAQRFAVGRSTVSDIMKRKQTYISQFMRSSNGEMRRFNYICKFKPINDLVWQWYQQSKAEGVVVNGPILKQKALEIAKDLSLTDFKASNGWLDSWLRRFSVGGKYGAKKKSFEDEDLHLSELSDIIRPKDGSTLQTSCTSGYGCNENLRDERESKFTEEDDGFSRTKNQNGKESKLAISLVNGEAGQQASVSTKSCSKGKSRGRRKASRSLCPPTSHTPAGNPCSFGTLTGMLGASMAYHDVLQTLTQLKRFAIANEPRYLDPIQSMITITIENILKDKPVAMP